MNSLKSQEHAQEKSLMAAGPEEGREHGCRAGRGEGAAHCGAGFSGCKPLYIQWRNSNVLLNSTGNYSRHPETDYNGSECEKECPF